MRRIIWLAVCSALLLCSKVFTPIFDQTPWIALVALIAVAEMIIILTMIPQPIKEFIQPHMTSLEQELNTRIQIIHAARASGGGFVQVFVNGSGWLEGRVLELSISKGVLLLEVADGLGAEMIFLRDVVRVRTAATKLGKLLSGDAHFVSEKV